MAAFPDSPLTAPTDPRWVTVALADFASVLRDHAHCERKAAATAMSLVGAYPDLDELVKRCTRLAQEELRHFQQVHQLLRERALPLGRDLGDPYAQALSKLARTDPDGRRTDRLLVAALIEARSCERLQLLADGLGSKAGASVDGAAELSAFYATLATSEAGHFRLFVELASRYADADGVARRLSELCAAEAAIVAGLPLLPRIH